MARSREDIPTTSRSDLGSSRCDQGNHKRTKRDETHGWGNPDAIDCGQCEHRDADLSSQYDDWTIGNLGMTPSL